MTIRCAVFSNNGGPGGECQFLTLPRVGDKVRLPWMRFIQTVVQVLHTGTSDAGMAPMVALFVEGVLDDAMAE